MFEGNKISIAEIFDDIKLTSDQKPLKEEGYVFVSYEDISLGLVYMAKPSKEIIDYIHKSGRGMPSSTEVLANGTIFFNFDSSYYVISSVSPGIINEKEFDEFKKTASLVGPCIVKKAYENFKNLHPNYALKSFHWPEKKFFESIKRSARIVWKAVGYSLNNEEIKNKAENGDYDEFYLDQRKIDFLNNNFDLDLPELNSSLLELSSNQFP